MMQDQQPLIVSTSSTVVDGIDSASQWLLSADGKWTEEDEKQWKRQQHRENMVYFRRKKKAQQLEMKSQHKALETQLKQHLMIQRALAARATRIAEADQKADQLHQIVRDLVTEREGLRNENLALQRQIDHHVKLHKIIYQEQQLLMEPEPDNYEPKHQEGNSTLAFPRGQYVYFNDGAPLFYFQPLTMNECDAVQRKYDAFFAQPLVGVVKKEASLLGWTTEQAIERINMASCMPLMLRVQFFKRIGCAPGAAAATMDRVATESWPIMVDPEMWNIIHRQEIQSRFLQKIDDDAFVLVRNEPRIFGKHKVNIRFINLVTRRETVNSKNQRVITFYLLIANTSANRRNQEAEARPDVKWIHEGGAFMSLTLVNDETVDVVYDHFAGCMNEEQSQHMLIEWGNIVVRWEQFVYPSLLTMD